MNKKVQFVVQDTKYPKPTKLNVCTSMTSLGEKLANRCRKAETLDAITSTTLLSIIIDDTCDDQEIVDITPTVIQVPLDTRCMISSDDDDIADDVFAMDCEQTDVDPVLNEIMKVQDSLTDKIRTAPLIENEKSQNLKNTHVSVTSTKPPLEEIPEKIPENTTEKILDKIKEKNAVSPTMLTDLNDKPSCDTSVTESMELGVTQILGLSSIHVAIKSPEVTEEVGKTLMRAHAVLSMDTKVYEGLCIMRAKTPEPAIDMEKELDVVTPIDIPPIDVEPADIPPIMENMKDEIDIKGEQLEEKIVDEEIVVKELVDEEIVDDKLDKIIPVPDVSVAPVEYVPPPPDIPPEKEKEEEEEEKENERERKKENEIEKEKVPPKRYPKEKPKKPPMKVPTKVPSVKPEARREPEEAKLKMIDKIDGVPTYVSLVATTSKISRRSFCPCELPPCHRPKKICWNDGIEILWPPTITVSRCHKNVALCNVHSRKSRCPNSENSDISFPKLDNKWNVLNQVFYPCTQDPTCATNRYRFRSSIDCQSGGSVNDCAKRKTICGYSSHSGLCRDNSKHYCQHVNGINTDARVKQYCHHANNYQIWSDCECYGRNNPSFYWPKQTSYFVYPWM